MPRQTLDRRRAMQSLLWLVLAAVTASLALFLASTLGGSFDLPLLIIGWMAILAAAVSALTFAFRMGDGLSTVQGRPSSEPVAEERSLTTRTTLDAEMNRSESGLTSPRPVMSDKG